MTYPSNRLNTRTIRLKQQSSTTTAQTHYYGTHSTILLHVIVISIESNIAAMLLTE